MTIRQLIQHKLYQEAIELSRKEPLEEFFLPVYSRLKKHRLIDEQFWQALFSTGADHLLASDFIYPVLREFWKHLNPSDQLIAQFARTEPKAFIRSIRFLKMFTKDGFLEKHQDLLKSEPYFQAHLEMMKGLCRVRQDLEKKVSSYKPWLRVLGMVTFLTKLIIWWEENQTENRAIKSSMFETAEKALQEFFTVQQKIDQSNIWFSAMIFKQEIENVDEKGKRHFVQYLADLRSLIKHNNETIDDYCHGLTNDFDESGKYIEDQKVHQKFAEDGHKLYAFDEYLHILSIQITDQLVEDGTIKLPDKNDFYFLQSQGHVLGNLVLDYCKAFEVMTEDQALIPQLFGMLNAHTHSRYRNRLKLLFERKMTVSEALVALISIEDGNGFPIQISDFREFVRLTKGSFMKYINDVTSNRLINLSKSQPHKLELLSKPLIELPANQILYLMPIAFEANLIYRAYYNIVNSTLKSDREFADLKFEKTIAMEFPEAMERKSSFRYPPTGNKEGDIDVAIRDGNEILLIEAKRTTLRTESEGIWKEKEERFFKGALQLYKAEKGLKDQSIKGLFDEEINPNVNITCLIVSPWFEYDHEEIGQFRKVSWFEIQYVLRNMKSDGENAPNQLRAIIDLIISGSSWPKIFKANHRIEEMMERFVDIYRHVDFDTE